MVRGAFFLGQGILKQGVLLGPGQVNCRGQSLWHVPTLTPSAGHGPHEDQETKHRPPQAQPRETSLLQDTGAPGLSSAETTEHSRDEDHRPATWDPRAHGHSSGRAHTQQHAQPPAVQAPG